MVLSYKSMKRIFFILLLAFSLVFFSDIPSVHTASWTYTGDMSLVHGTHTQTLMQNGKVLVVGDETRNPNGAPAEIYDPASGTWSRTPPGRSRYSHTATLLPNGKVLVAGGQGTGVYNQADLYDPVNNTWTPAASMHSDRYNHTATLLQDGRVLVAGGYNMFGQTLSAAEIYDPASGTWSITGSMNVPRWFTRGVILENGKVLVIGGNSTQDYFTYNTIPESTAELYDPSTGTWTMTGSMNNRRDGHIAILLNNGKVLVAGGYDGTYLASAELYDSLTGTWSYTTSMHVPRSRLEAVKLPNGKVLVTGGTNGAYSFFYTSVEIYDPNSPPNVGVISVSNSLIGVNNSVTASAPFTDPDILDTHNALWSWGDGTTSAGIVSETNGSGTVSGTHTYTAAGVYTVTLTVIDNNQGSGIGLPYEYIVVYDPTKDVAGGGTITSPVGAYTLNPTLTGKAIFGFRSLYHHGAAVPDGSTIFRVIVANFSFKSTSYDWLVIAGAKAQYKGRGTANENTYSFILTAIDGEQPGGGGIDRFRIKIWDPRTGDIIYDNQMGSLDNADPSTVIDTGNITISR